MPFPPEPLPGPTTDFITRARFWEMYPHYNIPSGRTTAVSSFTENIDALSQADTLIQAESEFEVSEASGMSLAEGVSGALEGGLGGEAAASGAATGIADVAVGWEICDALVTSGAVIGPLAILAGLGIGAYYLVESSKHLDPGQCDSSKPLTILGACGVKDGANVCPSTGVSITNINKKNIVLVTTNDKGEIQTKCGGEDGQVKTLTLGRRHPLSSTSLLMSIARDKSGNTSLETLTPVPTFVKGIGNNNISICIPGSDGQNEVCKCPKQIEAPDKTILDFVGSQYGAPDSPGNISCKYQGKGDQDHRLYSAIAFQEPPTSDYYFCGAGSKGVTPGLEPVYGKWILNFCKDDDPEKCLFQKIPKSSKCMSYFPEGTNCTRQYRDPYESGKFKSCCPGLSQAGPQKWFPDEKIDGYICLSEQDHGVLSCTPPYVSKTPQEQCCHGTNTCENSGRPDVCWPVDDCSLFKNMKKCSSDSDCTQISPWYECKQPEGVCKFTPPAPNPMVCDTSQDCANSGWPKGTLCNSQHECDIHPSPSHAR